MTTIISGTTGVTFPVTAGSTSPTAASPGKVLQVVQGTRDGGYDGVSSSTYVAVTSFSATITPTSASSKILVIYNTNHYLTGGIGPAFTTVYCNGSNCLTSADTLTEFYESAGNWRPVSGSFLHSPASTSSLTYQVYAKTVSGTVLVGGDSGAGQKAASVITLMEIAA